MKIRKNVSGSSEKFMWSNLNFKFDEKLGKKFLDPEKSSCGVKLFPLCGQCP